MRSLKLFGEGIATLVSGLLIVSAWLIGEHHDSLSVILYIFAFVIGGFVKAKEGLLTLIKEKDVDVNLLMMVAAIGAASIGYWAEGAMLIFIFSLSGTLETYTLARSKRDISKLMEMKPEQAVLLEDGKERVVNAEELEVGDLIIVKPGERLPADGIVREGSSSVNQASITGESIPVDKTVGDEVFAGTLNGQGALFIEVTQPGGSTLFSKIIKLVQEAQSEQPASQRFMKRFERIYSRIVILVTLLLIVFPPLFGVWSYQTAIYKAMVFLVVASPCALVASIMPAMLSAIAKGARKGLLFKGGAHLEHLAQTRVVAFDKTGTLTKGEPEVTDILPFLGYSGKQILEIAASVESLSEHPLARAIVRKAEQAGLEVKHPEQFQSMVGSGVEAVLDGTSWRISKVSAVDAELFTEQMIAAIDRLQQEGKTVSVLYNKQGIAALIAFQDAIRPQAKKALARLKRRGIKLAMLTGDQPKTAQAIAKEVGIDLVYAQLLPEDKVKKIKELQHRYEVVTMVGDGVNDAPALATATVGVAMGNTGSDAALETADLVLMNDNIAHIAEAIQLGKRTKKIIYQNLIFSICVIVLLIVSNFTYGLTLPLGVIGHEGSTLLVILNGLRLLK